MQNAHKITPHLWYDQEAKEAAAFYCSLFSDSKITNITTLKDTPTGDCDVVSFQLSGQPFMAISAGPLFKFNPSISFTVNFDPSRDGNARKQLDAAWDELSKGGKPLMALDEYPFSKRYGWIQDKYGLSWQLILSDPSGEQRPFIVPSLMFTGDVCGKAEEASDFYISVFRNSKRGNVFRYPGGMEPDREGTIMFTDFTIENQWLSAMDSAREHNFKFNEAISFMINCDTQDEIDYYWQKLSAFPDAEQCGWCKDKYGVSWQISSPLMGKVMSKGSPEQVRRVTQAFLKMKKVDIGELTKAYNGR